MSCDPSVGVPRTIELDERILIWMDELARPCPDARKSVLAGELASALEGIMGIERDMLASILMIHAVPPSGPSPLSPSLSVRF